MKAFIIRIGNHSGAIDPKIGVIDGQPANQGCFNGQIHAYPPGRWALTKEEITRKWQAAIDSRIAQLEEEIASLNRMKDKGPTF